jgi:hypothetical protein
MKCEAKVCNARQEASYKLLVNKAAAFVLLAPAANTINFKQQRRSF